MCYMVKNWALFIALIIILEPVKFYKVGSSVVVGTLACVVSYFATLETGDIGSIILVGLGYVGMHVSPVIPSLGLVVTSLSSLLEPSSMVWSASVVDIHGDDHIVIMCGAVEEFMI
jgi:hypothetical protein